MSKLMTQDLRAAGDKLAGRLLAESERLEEGDVETLRTLVDTYNKLVNGMRKMTPPEVEEAEKLEAVPTSLGEIAGRIRVVG